MYNSATEIKIRQIPKIGKIDVDRLPQELTRVFAEIVSLRKQLSDETITAGEENLDNIQMLSSLANNLETILLTLPRHPDQESIAFVGATAHYLLYQINNLNRQKESTTFAIDSINPAVSAIILFLIANSQADAAEVAKNLEINNSENHAKSILALSIKSLSTGKLMEIVDMDLIIKRSEVDFNTNEDDIELTAETYLWDNLNQGIKNIAFRLLGISHDNIDYFQTVVNLSILENGEYTSIYSGPHHLAKLLKILERDLITRGIVNINAPSGIEKNLWSGFLKEMAKERPYFWENHSNAIQNDFLKIGTSSILTFPTGAGKSTLAELKIAATLLSGKSVAYIVPTHALEEQIKNNAVALFKNFTQSTSFEIGSEYTDIDDEDNIQFHVFTPERCLTLLNIAPEKFINIGLIVFDEFHLIHGKVNGTDRRNIDAMFCLLTLFSTIPQADYLLISAMVENSDEIAKWVSTVTNRQCHNFNSSWKPTRQMLGCVVFPEDEINKLDQILQTEKKSKTTKNPNKKTKDLIKAHPYSLYSLRNIWESKRKSDYFISDLLDREVVLGANTNWQLTPNRNNVAARIAVQFGLMGLKTLVFVDTPRSIESTQKEISAGLKQRKVKGKSGKTSQASQLDSIAKELGHIKYAYIPDDENVCIHHGNMLALERSINEHNFKEKNEATAMVATATLAQGINLPAEVVIIAGDDRYNEETGFRERIDPHEILNAAGRAGRAGMAAQGVVLLIPGEIVTINKKTPSRRWWRLKNEVFSKSDQCIKIKDPLQYFLDSVQSSELPPSTDEKNILFRLRSGQKSQGEIKKFFKNSFLAFQKAEAQKNESFERLINGLIKRKNSIQEELNVPKWAANISVKMGVNPQVILSLGNSIDESILDKIHIFSVAEYIDWLIGWIIQDEMHLTELFSKKSTVRNICKALSLKGDDVSIKMILDNFHKISELITMYINGKSYEEINIKISGAAKGHLDDARNFVLKLIPDISFVFGIFSLIVVDKLKESGMQHKSIPLTIRVLASCIREGFDSHEKLIFKYKNRLQRVECHLDYVKSTGFN